MLHFFQRVRHYLSVYAGFLSTSFAKEMGFRLNFFLLILVDLSFYLMSIFSVHIIYEHTSVVGLWNEQELLFFVSFMLVVDQFHMALVSESFWRLSPAIRMGELDFILVKPISSLFQVFFRYIRPATTLLFLPVWLHLIYRAWQLDFGLGQLLLLPLVVVLATLLLFGIEIGIATSMFWLQYGQGVNFIRIELQNMSRWPDFVYQRWIRRVFSFGVPVLMVGSQSAYFLLDPGQPWPLVALAVACVLVWAVTAMLWKLGLRRYESASS